MLLQVHGYPAYPFTPVAAIPPTTYFCRKAKIIMIGMMEIIDAARMDDQSIPLVPINVLMAIWIVYFF